MKPGKSVVLILANVALVVFSLAVSTVMSEVVYRAYLYKIKAPDRFVRKTLPALPVYGRPFWIYDERFGYVYPKGEKVPLAGISNGRVAGCTNWEYFNEQGNIGKVIGNYAKADLKILVFGDSFAATVHDGITWPLLLQERLAQRLGRGVHVVNFGRDGYGILQMFDLAAAKIPEWKPNLAIISFTTNDLQRVRFWRTISKVDGYWRYLVSPEPTPDPDPLKSYDTGLYHPEATAEWCQVMRSTDRRDRVLQEVERVLQLAGNVGDRRVANIYTLRHSYLLARIRHGDPFRGIPDVISFPVIQYGSYNEDSRFMESLRAVEASGVPFALVHLAFYPELKARTEYITNYQEARLLKSLSEVTRKPVLETTRHTKLPVERLERLIQSPDNYHPSLAGLEFYAEAVAEMLMRSGVVR